LADRELAADVLADILARLEAAWQAGAEVVSAVQALLRVFKIGIRMHKSLVAALLNRDGQIAPDALALGAAICEGVELLFQMLAHAHAHRQHHVAKLTLQVLRISSESSTSCGAVAPCWSNSECVECLAAIVTAPVDEADPDALVMQWKGKARALLTWMHLCINLPAGDQNREHKTFVENQCVP
jgi:hypothetical protein